MCVCVWESVRVKVKFIATTTTPAPRVRVLPTRCVRDERWKSTEFAGKHRDSDVCAGDFDLTCLTSSWAQSSASAAQQQSGFGSAACNSLAFNFLGVASHDHYFSAAQLHYEQRVCLSEWERGRKSVIALQRADDKFVIRKISRWALNYLICLMKTPRANAELCTLFPLFSHSLPLPLWVHQLSDKRRFKVLFIVYILSLAFLGNIFIYLFVSQYLRVLHLNEFTTVMWERERDR